VNGERWTASDEAQADWLGGAHAEEAVTGFDATGWEARTLIAHAIYELPGVSLEYTHDDAHRAALASGSVEPLIIGDVDLNEVGVVTGAGLGFAKKGFTRIEYAYHLMAADAGVDMTECRLLPEGDRAHFLTRRFDRRPDGTKVHSQTLCGLAHLDFNLASVHDYSQYLEVVDDLGLGADALEQAFRRIVFNVAAVNRDDHTKNLSFLCDESGAWSLSPAYDVTFAHNPVGEWTSRHQMSVNGKFEGIDRKDLFALADRFAVPNVNDAYSEVVDAVQRWQAFADLAEVDERASAEIRKSQQHLAPG